MDVVHGSGGRERGAQGEGEGGQGEKTKEFCLVAFWRGTKTPVDLSFRADVWVTTRLDLVAR